MSKVLSLTQPWASLVCLGAKKIETRSWHTNYRGGLLIHASKAYPKWAKECEEEEPFLSALRPGGVYCEPAAVCGQIIGQCRLVDCIHTQAVARLNPLEAEFGDFSPGRYAWILEQASFLFHPIPAKGALGLWEHPSLNWSKIDT